MKGLLQATMMCFSLKTCSCCCCCTISIFFRHLSANVSDGLGRYCTNSTRPNPPTPIVPTMSRSFSSTYPYSARSFQIQNTDALYSTVSVTRCKNCLFIQCNHRNMVSCSFIHIKNQQLVTHLLLSYYHMIYSLLK